MGAEATLHPQIAAIVEAMRSGAPLGERTADIEQRRRDYRDTVSQRWPETSTLASVEDVTLDLSGVRAPGRLYVPTWTAGRGLVVFFHGGSFVLGDLDSHDGLCRRLAVDTGLRLLSIEYRLAPENPFPAAVDDAVAAVRHVMAERSRFASSHAGIVVMGESAGATLAAVAATHTRGEPGGPIGQVLIYPTLGPELLTESAQCYGTGYLLEVDDLRRDYELYLNGFADRADSRVSPLMSLDLTGSPPAIVVVAECDPLRDEALAYAGLLEHFGTSVEILEAEGMVHGFLRLGGVVPDAMAIVDDLAEHLSRLVTAGA
jgi:acetyl esterase